jgi:transporter family-2 protein
MQLIPYLVAFVAGLMLTVQVGLNATLGRAVGNIRFAVLANFTVGLIGILIYVVASRDAWPTRQGLATVPMWAWLGGLLGAFYVAAATVVGPRIGAAALLALTVLGQLMASLLVDQCGWLGFPLQPLSATRIAGALLLLGGVALIVR